MTTLPDLRNNYLAAIEKQCEAVCKQYETSAPTVAEWADGLYRRGKGDVTIRELFFLESLFDGSQWTQANYAANQLYKLLSALGKDTTGHAGF